MQQSIQPTDKITIVFIGGFLSPPGMVPFPVRSTPPNINLISVTCSGVSSIHDRIMQIFYELKGGTIHYGKNHSEFHGHSETGINFPKGRFSEWDSDNPIHLIGHSFGGVTALALQSYLKQETRFHNYKTNANWIKSLITINSPLNGCLFVYSLGANLTLAPVVRWGAFGCVVGWLAHILEYIDSTYLKSVYDFQLGYWNLSHRKKQSLQTLICSLLGFCIHSTTDNSAYDMTIHSQLEWSKIFETLPEIYYLSFVGVTYQHTSWLHYLFYSCREVIFREAPTTVKGVDTSHWMRDGFDGLLSATTQSYPRLSSSLQDDQQHGQSRRHPYLYINELPKCDIATNNISVSENGSSDVDDDTEKVSSDKEEGTNNNNNNNNNKSNAFIPLLQSGIWYVKKVPFDHIGVIESSESWSFILLAIQTFHKSHPTNHHPSSSNLNLNPPMTPSTQCHPSTIIENNSQNIDEYKEDISYPIHTHTHTPDMQIPQWCCNDRPIVTFGFKYLIAIKIITSIVLAWSSSLLVYSPVSNSQIADIITSMTLGVILLLIIGSSIIELPTDTESKYYLKCLYSSDVTETIFSILKILLLFYLFLLLLPYRSPDIPVTVVTNSSGLYSFPNSTTTFYINLYIMLIGFDALATTFFVPVAYEYTIPVAKCVYAISLMVLSRLSFVDNGGGNSTALFSPFSCIADYWGNDVASFGCLNIKENKNMLVLMVLVIELVFLLPKFGWLLAYYRKNSLIIKYGSYFWMVLWTAFLISIFAHFFIFIFINIFRGNHSLFEISYSSIRNSYSISGGVLMYCCAYTIIVVVCIVNKLRDLSEAFQVYCILNKYENKRIIE